LWDLPVNKRLLEVADIAKTLLGPKPVEASTTITRDTLHLSIVVKNAKCGGMCELNVQLLSNIVLEALCMERSALHAKGKDVVLRFSGSLSLAEDAEAESESRKRRSDDAGAASKAFFCFATVQLIRAFKVLYRDRCRTVWESYIQMSGLYPVQCARTWRALGWLLLCITLLFAWLLRWFGSGGYKRLAARYTKI
jgi:hypothetical protein